MTTPMRAAVCDAVVTMHDIHMSVNRRCELVADHDGAHSVRMDGCEPRAELTWWSEAEVS